LLEAIEVAPLFQTTMGVLEILCQSINLTMRGLTYEQRV
jgi:hypothetical protein